MTARVRVLRVPVPAGDDPLASPEAWAVHGSVLVDRAVELDGLGYDDLALDARTILTTMVEEQEHKRVLRYVAVADGGTDGSAAPSPESVVGRAVVGLPMRSNPHLALAHVRVLPGWRRQGVGTALWEACLADLRAAGRTVVVGDADLGGAEPPPGPDALVPPTGSGRFPRSDPGAQFALRQGFVLEQVDRHSHLPVPVPAGRLDPLRAGARAAASGYRVHVWCDEVPEERLAGLATLYTRMSTDAPNAGLEIEEDPWDADRVRDKHRAMLAGGSRFVLAAAEHEESDTLAGFSCVSFSEDRPEVVFQDDTLVLREHRGHRLGLLVKVAVLDELSRANPAARRVHTWNAQENDHMLAINVALGFAPAGVQSEWQLHL
ncbi:GNAT family N-acetyltransferase [Antribacter gilvus]|uniref:GNAT family N-acetyltransferase n=1 Tax=Antribacter gilvus TaxID=2304675 RepID=UPI000F7A5CC6|nr:GNAT family N-acetyltransferase [Antribacter gilvus]